jgi:hypothetical protein
MHHHPILNLPTSLLLLLLLLLVLLLLVILILLLLLLLLKMFHMAHIFRHMGHGLSTAAVEVAAQRQAAKAICDGLKPKFLTVSSATLSSIIGCAWWPRCCGPIGCIRCCCYCCCCRSCRCHCCHQLSSMVVLLHVQGHAEEVHLTVTNKLGKAAKPAAERHTEQQKDSMTESGVSDEQLQGSPAKGGV